MAVSADAPALTECLPVESSETARADSRSVLHDAVGSDENDGTTDPLDSDHVNLQLVYHELHPGAERNQRT